MKESKKKDKLASKKRRYSENEGIKLVNQLNVEGKRVGENDEEKKGKGLKSNKGKSGKITEAAITETDKVYSAPDDGSDGKFNFGMKDKKKKRNKEKMKEAGVHEYVQHSSEFGEDSNPQIDQQDRASDEKKNSKVIIRKRKSEKLAEAEIAETDKVYTGQVYGSDGKIKTGMKDKKKKKNKEKRKETDVKPVHDDEAGEDSNQQSGEQDGANDVKRKSKVLRNKKRKGKKLDEFVATETNKAQSELDDGSDGQINPRMKDKKKIKLKRKKRNKDKTKEAGVQKLAQQPDEVGDDSNQHSGKSKNVYETKENDHSSQKDTNLLENSREAEEDDVYEISSGDEDYTTGMAKWINDYHLSSPGVEILQKRIDDWLANYEAQQEQAQKEREAQAAEGGWTVVTHHKGRKKTTDSESGVTMGSVAQAAVMDKLTKKKNKEVGFDFYRFQKREAQKNEIMMLQSKFEEDKKRIQQMRAARKFRPY